MIFHLLPDDVFEFAYLGAISRLYLLVFVIVNKADFCSRRSLLTVRRVMLDKFPLDGRCCDFHPMVKPCKAGEILRNSFDMLQVWTGTLYERQSDRNIREQLYTLRYGPV